MVLATCMFIMVFSILSVTYAGVWIILIRRQYIYIRSMIIADSEL